MKGDDTLLNMPTVDMNFSYDANLQSYPHTMNYPWLGPSDVGPSNVGPSNIGPFNIGVGSIMLPPSSVQNKSDDDDK